MVFEESELVELKAVFGDNVKKEILAFANTRGGRLLIGVEDDGTVCGVEDPDGIICRISSAIRDSVKPDLTMFLHYRTLTVEGKSVVEAEVQCGAHRPYYLAAKGLRPEGVYVRQGTSSVPASDQAIRQMIKETDGDSYEAMRSLNQELTFERAGQEFARKGLELSPASMRTMGLTDGEGLYTNLALLLSDQCPHIIKGAAFRGTDKNDFQDRREFAGSLFKQLEEAYQYLDLRNNTAATFEGLYRRDLRDYPEVALREALLNAIIHRDYAASAATLVSVYSDRVEMISVGGLAGGLSYEDMMLGVSFCRNRNLAAVFYRLELIEAYGTGIGRIMESYPEGARAPKLLVSSGAFKVVLPNRNAASSTVYGESGAQPGTDFVGEEGTVYGRKAPETDPRVLNIRDLFRGKPFLSRAEIEASLGVSTATACRLIRRAQAKGLIVSRGEGRSTRYFPAPCENGRNHI